MENYRRNYLKEFDLYINTVLIVYMFYAKIFPRLVLKKKRVQWGYARENITNKQANNNNNHNNNNNNTKECHKGIRDTEYLLYIDQHILNENKTRRKKSSYGVDYQQKANDIVPQSWIINCLKMYVITDEVINFIEKTKKTWREELTAGGKSLTEAKI